MGTLELTQIEALELLAKEAKGKLVYRRVQSVLLQKKFGKDVEDIAEMLHLHKRTVYKHCERYFKEGLKAFEPKRPGPKKGEGPRLMSQEQEQAVLEKLESQASQGQVLKGGAGKNSNRTRTRKDNQLNHKLHHLAPQWLAKTIASPQTPQRRRRGQSPLQKNSLKPFN